MSLLDRIWSSHVVTQEPGHPAVLYIDLHLLHEVTSPQAFSELRRRGLPVRRPDRTIATMDHSIPTIPGPPVDRAAERQLEQLEENCREFGIQLHGPESEHGGIVHVIGPELGLTQPGMTIVCGDSHTATHGAFGALAFGIGSSEVAHVLATQCLLQHRPAPLEVRVDGRLGRGVSAKDLILALIAQIGTGGGAGHVLEYTGSAIRALDMEGRMTVCNMSIEAGARAGMVAPDDTTFSYLAGREHAPRGADWDAALARWRGLRPRETDGDFAGRVALDASKLEPMITYGTNPAMAVPVSAPVPTPEEAPNAQEREARAKALEYMAVRSGRPLLGQPVDVVFIGSCTNSRLSDLNQMARVLRGRKVADGVRLLVVPGSRRIKREAEAAGIDRVVRDARGEWREPGCSMCIAMNGDELRPGEYAVSTSNRNFEGRQGKGSRTFLASPLTAAACAVTGQVTDVRTLLED